MSTRTQLKAFFETGDVPTQTQFADLIDSLAHTTDDSVATQSWVTSGFQPLDADLTTIAGLTATTDSFLQAKAGAWAARTIAQVKTDLGLTGTNSGDITINSLGVTAYTIAVGTTGTDINVAASGSTITVHVPDAGASARGVITTGTQTIAGAKTFTSNVTMDGAANNYPFIRIQNTAKNGFLAAAETGQADSIIVGTQGSWTGDSTAVNGAVAAGRTGGGIGFYTNGSTTRRVLIDSAGKTTLFAASTATASLNIPSGTAPTTPVDGDIWFDGTDLKIRVSGTTYTLTKT